MTIFSFLKLILGLSFFLFGMHVMSANLEKMAGGRLEHLLKKMTANPFVSMALGAAITIAIQSSSATTVMLVGLVNSGIMQFSQTLYVIFGANIGTTLTAWILSLSGIQSDNVLVAMLKPENFSPILALVGVIMLMVSKSDKKKSIGTILVGFSILMYGMTFMTDAVSPLADMPDFAKIMVSFRNPLVGVLFGTVFTAVIQSSAASVGILQALSLTGNVTCGMAIPIVMGQNIGTCVTSLISCIGTNANAKRVATIHLSINVIGTTVFLSLYSALNALFRIPLFEATVSPVGIAMIHTVFNVAITLLLMPFSKWLLRLAERVVPENSQTAPAQTQNDFRMDERLLRSPSVAIGECDNYTVKMCELANETLHASMSLMESYSSETAEKILHNEEILDQYEDRLGTYLVKLSGQALSKADSQRTSKMLHTIGDFERLGDHAVNLLKVAQEVNTKKISFSPEAEHEIGILTKAIMRILDIATAAYRGNDVQLAGQVEPLEQVIDTLTGQIKNNHVNRLQRGDCTIGMGFVLSDMLNNYERISDHCSNIAVAIIELVHNSFDTHEYLNGVKYGNEAFREAYDEFAAQYTL